MTTCALGTVVKAEALGLQENNMDTKQPASVINKEFLAQVTLETEKEPTIQSHLMMISGKVL